MDDSLEGLLALAERLKNSKLTYSTEEPPDTNRLLIAFGAGHERVKAEVMTARNCLPGVYRVIIIGNAEEVKPTKLLWKSGYGAKDYLTYRNGNKGLVGSIKALGRHVDQYRQYAFIAPAYTHLRLLATIYGNNAALVEHRDMVFIPTKGVLEQTREAIEKYDSEMVKFDALIRANNPHLTNLCHLLLDNLGQLRVSQEIALQYLEETYQRLLTEDLSKIDKYPVGHADNALLSEVIRIHGEVS